MIRFGLVTCSAIVLLGVFVSQLDEIRDSMPYPQHSDERVIMLGAQRILESGDWDSKVYAYPSLPIYINTVGLALGMISKSGLGPQPIQVNQLGRLFGPYYEQPAVVAVSRKIWALLGCLCMLACALIAYRLGGAAAMLITALGLALSDMLRGLSSNYINVDLPMAMFGCGVMLWLVRATPRSPAAAGGEPAARSPSMLAPGLLCGATIACKYTGFMLLLPCLLWIWLFVEHKAARSAQILAISAVGFLLFCPYFPLRLPEYLNAIAFENYHYRVRGHAGFDIEPGMTQVYAYLNNLRDGYGWGLMLAAFAGCLVLLRREPRLGLVILSLPIATLVFLSTYKVHFVRNSVLLFALVPVFAALGLTGAWQVLAQLVTRAAFHWPRLYRRLPIQLTASALLAAVVVPTLPIERALAAYRHPADSRNLFGRWAASNLSDPVTLLVPTVFALSRESLPQYVRVVPLDLANEAEIRARATPGAYMLLPVWNTWKRRSVKLLRPLQAGLAAVPPHHTLAHFDGSPVIPTFEKDLSVNPAFDIVQVDD